MRLFRIIWKYVFCQDSKNTKISSDLVKKNYVLISGQKVLKIILLKSQAKSQRSWFIVYLTYGMAFMYNCTWIYELMNLNSRSMLVKVTNAIFCIVLVIIFVEFWAWGNCPKTNLVYHCSHVFATISSEKLKDVHYIFSIVHSTILYLILQQ